VFERMLAAGPAVALAGKVGLDAVDRVRGRFEAGAR